MLKSHILAAFILSHCCVYKLNITRNIASFHDDIIKIMHAEDSTGPCTNFTASSMQKLLSKFILHMYIRRFLRIIFFQFND